MSVWQRIYSALVWRPLYGLALLCGLDHKRYHDPLHPSRWTLLDVVAGAFGLILFLVAMLGIGLVLVAIEAWKTARRACS